MAHLFKIKIADHIIQVETVHIRSMAMCRDYICEGTPDVSIRITPEDIEKAKDKYRETDEGCTRWEGSLETIVLHEKLSNSLLPYGIFMMHGAAVAYRDAAYIFTGRSGIGKTTHVKKWLDRLTESFIVNGDKPFIHTFGDGAPPLACASPWAGKESMYTNISVPLKAIAFIERAEENSMQQISFSQAFPSFLSQVYRPEDEQLMRETLRLIQRAGAAVSFWRFKCNNFKDDCFDVAYNALVKGQT